MKLIPIILSMLLPALSFAGNQSILEKVKATTEYKDMVRDYNGSGGSFSCSEPEEVLTSKNYSRIKGDESRYSLAVLICIADPNDGLDAYQTMGLATIDAAGDIVSFKTAYVSQAD